MNGTKIICLKGEDWALVAATVINTHVGKTLKRQGKCNVMLTGGRSAQAIYKAWSTLPEFYLRRELTYYFGDERYVPSNNSESNFFLVMNTLFRKITHLDCSIVPMKINGDLESIALAYEKQLPDSIDILLLSAGEDGHIASLFPGAAELQETKRLVMPVYAPKYPYSRVTISPVVLTRSKKIFVFAFGAEKSCILSKARSAPDEIDTFPVRLVLNATWLTDSSEVIKF